MSPQWPGGLLLLALIVATFVAFRSINAARRLGAPRREERAPPATRGRDNPFEAPAIAEPAPIVPRKRTTRASDGYFRVPNGDPMAQLIGDNSLMAPASPPNRIEFASEYSETETSLGSEIWPPPMFAPAPPDTTTLSPDERRKPSV